MTTIKSMPAMSVANFVIQRALDEKTPISNLHLQKILYYLQAFYLVQTEGSAPIIDANFSRWPYGPIIKEVYYAYNQFGAAFITEISQGEQDIFSEVQSEELPQMSKSDLGEYEVEVIQFLKRLFIRTPWDLVELTHSQSIWSDYEDEIKTFSAPDYTNEDIYHQFVKNPGDQIWNG